MRYIVQLLVLFAALVNACGHSSAQELRVADGSGTIQTVLGPIDPSELGITLAHEHVFIDFTLPLGDASRWQLAFRQNPQTAEELQVWHTPFTELSQREFMLENLWRNRDTLLLQDVNTSVSELRAFRQLGGSAVIDVTSIGLGRSPEKLRQASADSGLHIVMGTGWYQSAWHPEGLSERSVDELTAVIVRDVVQGVGDTGIRAGIIGEVSAMYVSLEPEESVEARALRAAARASRMTGAALSIHQWIRDGEMLELSLQIVEEEGADLGRVILGHIDAVSAQNLDRLRALMDRGLTLEFDLFGTPYFLDRPELDDRPMADAIVALVKSGYRDRILMSHDVCTKLQQRAYGGKGFTYIQKQVVPYLLAHGLTAEDIHAIQVANPRRLLTIRSPATGVALSPGPAAGDSGESVQHRIQAALERLEPAGALGSVLSVTEAGKEPLIAEAGYADIERTAKLTAHHLFQIGSQTKMFTAAAVLLLQKRGVLDLDEPVANYVKGVPRAGELTIRQLLLHTGGIGDGIKYFDPPLGTRPDFEVTFDNHLFLGRVAGEKFAPGERWEYNNLGFVILGRVIESASGVSLDRFVRNNILQPLGMNDTWLGSLEEYPEGRMARGYFVDRKSGETVDTTMPDLSWASSAGDMVSSLGDMRKWARALLDEDNATGLSLEDFVADAVPVPDRGSLQQYGFGMMRLDVRGRPFWGHGGFIHGYVTLTLVEPSSGTIVMVMANLEGESAEIISAVEGVTADALELVQLAPADPLR